MKKYIFIFALILFVGDVHPQSKDSKLISTDLDSIQMQLSGITSELAQIKLDSLQSELYLTPPSFQHEQFIG